MFGKMIFSLMLALVSGSIGGMLFYGLGLPAPWLSGSMVGVTLAVLLRIPCEFPKSWHPGLFVILGLSMGSGVKPEKTHSDSSMAHQHSDHIFYRDFHYSCHVFLPETYCRMGQTHLLFCIHSWCTFFCYCPRRRLSPGWPFTGCHFTIPQGLHPDCHPSFDSGRSPEHGSGCILW